MTTSVNIKNPVTITNSPVMLTVVVVDAKGQPYESAHVSIKPSDAFAITNSSGEVQFKLGDAMKYYVTASYGSNTVTVPYYVTKNGATRLVINPVYVKSIEQQLHPSPWFSSGIVSAVGIGLGIVIILVVIWRLFLRRK
jgi:hypothetical protein